MAVSYKEETFYILTHNTFPFIFKTKQLELETLEALLSHSYDSFLIVSLIYNIHTRRRSYMCTHIHTHTHTEVLNSMFWYASFALPKFVRQCVFPYEVRSYIKLHMYVMLCIYRCLRQYKKKFSRSSNIYTYIT